MKHSNVRSSNNEKSERKKIKKYFHQKMALCMMTMSASLLLLYKVYNEQNSSMATLSSKCTSESVRATGTDVTGMLTEEVQELQTLVAKGLL
jgi:hypothetical protein